MDWRPAVGLLGAAVAIPTLASASDGATHYSLPASADAMINLFEQGPPRGNHYYLVVNALPFNTESRFVVRFDDLSDVVDLRPYDAARVTRALLQVYEAPGYAGIGDQRMRVSVYRLADTTNWDEDTVQRPGPRIAPGAQVTTQIYEATGVGGWVTWDVTEHIRYFVEHPERNKGFLVAGRPVDTASWTHAAITFESRDSVSPESAAGGRGLSPGHAPRLNVDVRPPLPRAMAPSPTAASVAPPPPPLRAVAPPPTAYTVATPSPTPTVGKKPPQKTKGAFTERVPVRTGPRWMTNFLRWLLGYQ